MDRKPAFIEPLITVTSIGLPIFGKRMPLLTPQAGPGRPLTAAAIIDISSSNGGPNDPYDN